MANIRSTLIALGVSAALLLPVVDAFARGGGRGGGGGGRGGGGGGGMGGGGRGGGGQGGGGAAAQAAPQENPTITADRTQVTSNTTALNSASAAYSKAVTDFSAKYMKNPDYSDAQKAVDDANKTLDAARDTVVSKLKTSSSEYKAALAKETDAKKKLDQINANGGNRDQRSTQAQAILDAGDAVSKIEKTALDTDTGYQDAKKKLADAIAALKTQKDALQKAIDEDPALAALKTTKDTAQQQLTDSQNKLKQDRVTLGG